MFEPRQTGNNCWVASIPDGKGRYLRTLRMVFRTKEECQKFCDERNR
jgi:hypothetical protein